MGGRPAIETRPRQSCLVDRAFREGWRKRSAQGNGSSPNSSWIRRRSRSRGSVSPPTQRPTVLTETPSCRAAASWVIPSRRSAVDIQSAKVAGRAVAPALGPATGGRAVTAGARPPTSAGTGHLARRLVGVQHVHLDVLGEDPEGDLDRPGRPGGVEQGAEHGLTDPAGALLVQRRLGEAAADEVTDLRDPGRPGRKGLGQHHHGDDLDRPVPVSVGQFRHCLLRAVPGRQTWPV